MSKFIKFLGLSLIYIVSALILCHLVAISGIVEGRMFGGIVGQILFGFGLSLSTIIIPAILSGQKS